METLHFAREHEHDDTSRLLLSAKKYPGVDMTAAVQQIEGRQTSRTKWPSWAEVEEVCYPPRLNREQSSSEATARYKAEVAGTGAEAADLTGGMGVDSFFLAQRYGKMHYCEQDESLCRVAEHNFRVLGQETIECHAGDSIAWLEAQENKVFDLLFIDPARRSVHGQRVAAFEDCTPNLLAHLPLLLSRCRRLMVKASPMLDLNAALRQLTRVESVHIVAVEGECKELLFVCGEERETERVCVNLHASGRDMNRFTLSEEQAAPARLSPTVGRYLYEPHAALMKGGCYRLLSQWYDMEAVDVNSHLYTSDRLEETFPGRVFEVLSPTPLNRKAIRTVLPNGKAHVVCRNYPVRADQLAHQLGLTEGGDLYVIATTVAGAKTGLLARRDNS